MATVPEAAPGPILRAQTPEPFSSELTGTLYRCWPGDIYAHIATFLPPNDVACSLRLVDRTAAQSLKGRAVKLSQPAPAWAFAARWSAPGSCRELTLTQRRQLVCLTAASGVLANLDAALHATKLLLPSELMVSAAGGGRLDVCRVLAERGCPTTEPARFTRIVGANKHANPLVAAAAGGHRDVCEWLLSAHSERHVRNTLEAALAAYQAGHADLGDWLRNLNPPEDPELRSHRQGRWRSVLEAAVEGCDLATLQALVAQAGGFEHGLGLDPWAGSRWAGIAAAAGRSPTPDWWEKLMWLDSQGCPRHPAVFPAAAARPDALERLTRLRTLVGISFPMGGTQHLAEAASTGRIDLLTWLLELPPTVRLPPDPYDPSVCTAAAAAGHLDALRLLYGAGYRVSPWGSMRAAARGGHVAVAGWLEAEFGIQALRLDGIVFMEAAAAGSVALMTWLYDRGCVMPARTWASAAGSGCEAALVWLAQAGCPLPDGSGPFEVASGNCDFYTPLVLRRLGLPKGGDDQGLVRSLMARARAQGGGGGGGGGGGLGLLAGARLSWRGAGEAVAGEGRGEVGGQGDGDGDVVLLDGTRRLEGEGLDGEDEGPGLQRALKRVARRCRMALGRWRGR